MILNLRKYCLTFLNKNAILKLKTFTMGLETVGKLKIIKKKYLIKGQHYFYLKQLKQQYVVASHLRTGMVVISSLMTLMPLFSIWHASTYRMIVRGLFGLSQMDSISVAIYCYLHQTLHSINPKRDGASLVKIEDMILKGMCHHSPIRRITSHALN